MIVILSHALVPCVLGFALARVWFKCKAQGRSLEEIAEILADAISHDAEIDPDRVLEALTGLHMPTATGSIK